MKRVLCVDDNQQICEVVGELLSHFEVRSALSAAAALALATSLQFDLFVLDVHLADENGFSLLSTLREYHPSTPAVFITANPDISFDEVAEAGGIALIRKVGGTFVRELVDTSNKLLDP